MEKYKYYFYEGRINGDTAFSGVSEVHISRTPLQVLDGIIKHAKSEVGTASVYVSKIERIK